MLENLQINNFQSHKASRLQFAPSVNTLQGNSDCGKSAVMRALNWLIFNPAGDYFISDWAKRGKTISAPCEVTLEANGHKITRRRDKDFNGYVMDGEVFEATRNAVPPQILEALGLGEVNVQRQLDPPFLLSLSAGEVSRYINSLVNLTRIDKWVTAVNGRARDLQKDVENWEAREKAATDAVAAFDYLPKLEQISAFVCNAEKRLIDLEGSINELSDSLDAYEKNMAINASIPDVDKVFSLLASASTSADREKEVAQHYNTLAGQIMEHFAKWEIVGRVPKFDQAVAALSVASEKRLRIAEADGNIKLLSESLAAHGKECAVAGGLKCLDKVFALLAEAATIRTKKEQTENKLVSLSTEINRRLSVVAPNVPEGFFENVALLERWQRIQNNLDNDCATLTKEIEKHERESLHAATEEGELKRVEAELNKMVCPLCGRAGCGTDKKFWRVMDNWAMAQVMITDITEQGEPGKWYEVARKAKEKAGKKTILNLEEK